MLLFSEQEREEIRHSMERVILAKILYEEKGEFFPDEWELYQPDLSMYMEHRFTFFMEAIAYAWKVQPGDLDYLDDSDVTQFEIPLPLLETNFTELKENDDFLSLLKEIETLKDGESDLTVTTELSSSGGLIFNIEDFYWGRYTTIFEELIAFEKKLTKFLAKQRRDAA